MTRIAVIGGGASGIVAAITAKRLGADVTLFERCDRIGRKILATGNGRCNYTNINTDVSKYHGKNADFVKEALKEFDVEKTMSFFKELGMLTKIEDNGKAFPYSLQASAVLDVLRFELSRLGVNVVTEFEVENIKKENDIFKIKSYDNRYEYADRIILSTGGKASSSLGSNGSGYDISKKMGHSVTRVFPSLVQVKTDSTYTKAMKGIKTDALVKFCAEKTIAKEMGELLFTDYGVSGPVIFNISRYCGEYKNAKLKIDLLPEIEYEDLRQMLEARRNKDITLENFFVGMLNKKIGMTITKYANVLPYSRTSDTLTSKEINSLCNAIKLFELNVEGTTSWNNAQVTAGGVNTDEVNSKTLESKIVKGLYITGELLDIDGDCGGYNLQWAWSSGFVAGKSSAEE